MYLCWFRLSNGGRFSFSMCLWFWLSKSSEGTDGGLYLWRKFFFFLLLYRCIMVFFFFFSIFVSQVFVFGVLQAFAVYFKRLVFFLLKKLQNSVLNVVVEYNFSIFNCESGRFLDDFFFFFHMWHHSLNCREKTSAFIYNI